MKVALCRIRKADAHRLFELYQKFAEKRIGCMKRDEEYYRELCGMEGDFQWAAAKDRGKIIGYAHGSYDKVSKLGTITEIVVDPDYDFIKTAELLARKLQSIYAQRDAAWVYAFSIREPRYSQVFRDMGFFASKGTGKFMFAVTDPSKFLQDIAPIIAARLGQTDITSSMVQIQCEGHCLSFRKEQEKVQQIFRADRDPDWRMTLDKDILARLLLGVVNVIDVYHGGQVIVETTLNGDTTEQLLETMFPKYQFLTLNQW